MLDELYAVLEHAGGPRRLGDCTGRMPWSTHGVYLFFEQGEYRENRVTPRIVRVGTHALTETSTTTLWDRLRTHRGSLGGRNPGSGNHRSSVFRLHIGTALIGRDGWDHAGPTWGKGSSAPAEVRAKERDLERAVSAHLADMRIAWIAVPDRTARATIERGLIGVLSNLSRPPVDPPSPQWLGHHAPHPKITGSGLWNVDYVERHPDPGIVDVIAKAVHG